MIGDLEGPVARLDDAGRIITDDFTLEWGVLAEDRWRLAHDERLRRSRVDDTPVYEQWLRVPGGDVILRTGVVNDGVGRALVLEFDNASSSAVMVALAGHRASVSLQADTEMVLAAGEPWMQPARPAGGLAVGGDIWAAVAAEPGADPVVGDGSAALLIAVPHRQSVRVMVAVEGPMPTREQTPAEIAAGWRTVASRALDIELPDAELTEAWRRVICDLIVEAGSNDPLAAAEAAWWLDLAGMADEADRGRGVLVAAAENGELTSDAAVAGLRALAGRDLIVGKRSGIDQLADVLSAIAGEDLDAETLELTANALQPTDPRAAKHARRLAARVAKTEVVYRGPHSRVGRGAAAVLGSVVAGHMDGRRLQLLPMVAAEWLGQSIDVRGLATAVGSVSFSVRWHGDRPALLWERIGGSDTVELCCPGLDPEWSSTERNGEALLTATATPGAN
jgi:hypothetical protein